MPQGSMVTIETEVVEHMMASLPAQTSEVIMRTFGISYNSWTKIRDGRPLRASVAHRLLDRLIVTGRDSPVSAAYVEG